MCWKAIEFGEYLTGLNYFGDQVDFQCNENSGRTEIKL